MTMRLKIFQPRRPLLGPLLLALSIVCVHVGCANQPGPQAEADGGYRTINAGPLRDTAAAREENTKGLAHLDAGELYQAEQAFKRAIKADLEFGPAHNNLGKIYFLKRDFYLAAHEFDDAIKLMPRHAGPHNNLGLTLLEAGRLDDAIDALRQATTLDASTVEYQANLVRALVQRGDRTEEVVMLLRVVATHDTRVQWRAWASHQLGAMGLDHRTAG